jgi:adenylate cyclase
MGVNVAARIEALADPGGICLSGSAHDQVKGKLDFALEALGERVVKNIAEPVRVYRVRFGAAPTVAPAPRTQPEPGSSGRPSIAILPFTNMSGDPEQEHFADGMTEDLITALSKFRELLIIARHSVFSYKGRLVAIPTVASELGVRYVLEGSVRKVGTRVRVTGQLIDGLTGGHLWAERYDRDLGDIFAIQDELTRRIVTELEVALSSGEQARAWQRSTSSVEAYEHMLRGREQLRSGTSEANAFARECFERAIDADPRFAFAHALLGWTHWADARANWSRSPDESLARAAALADKALALDAGQADAWALRGMVCLIQQRYEEAVTAAEHAIAEGANAAGPVMWAGQIFTFSGRPEVGLAMLQKVSRLSPLPPPHYFTVLGNCYRILGRNEEALDAYRRGLQEAPQTVNGLVGMALVLARAGRDAEARAAVMEALRLQPDFTRATWSRLACADRVMNQRDLDELERFGLA